MMQTSTNYFRIPKHLAFLFVVLTIMWNATAHPAVEIKASGSGDTEYDAIFNAELNAIKEAFVREIGSVASDNLYNKLSLDYKKDKSAFIQDCIKGSARKGPDNRYSITVKCLVNLSKVISYSKDIVDNVSSVQRSDKIEENKSIYIKSIETEYAKKVGSAFAANRGYKLVAKDTADYILEIDYVKCWQEDNPNHLGQYAAGCDGSITITKIRGGGKNAQKSVPATSQSTFMSIHPQKVTEGAQSILFDDLVKKASSEILRVWGRANTNSDEVEIHVDNVEEIKACRKLNKILSDASDAGTKWEMRYDDASCVCSFSTATYPGDISNLLLDFEDQADKEVSGNKFKFSSNME